MGPNALPVPNMKNGKAPDYSFFEIGPESHLSVGDKTHNLFTDLYLPLAKAKVGVSLSMIPVEYYKMSIETRDQRRARDFDAKGYAIGDLYIGTWIQIISGHEKWPDLLLTLNLKTASGTNLEAARYTDTPGYYFDLSAGRDISLSKTKLQSIRYYGLIGFYVYQTYLEDNRQNDAIMGGLGIDLNFKNINLSNQLTGYSGYLDYGDQPLVYRMKIKATMNQRLFYNFRFQYGLNDLDYTSLRFGFQANF